MKLKEFMPFIGDDHVEIIDEVYQGDTLFKGLKDDILPIEGFLEWDVISVHGCTIFDEDGEFDTDYVMIFVKNPKD